MNKLPQPVFEQVDQLSDDNARLFAFSPNRHTLGGTAYLIVGNQGSILVDCPAWTAEHQEFLQKFAPVKWLILTHRDAKGEAEQVKADLGCALVVQEQEAYLLPGIEVQTWQQNVNLSEDLQLLWTPGYSPGASCLYWGQQGGILFTGRHLLPTPQAPLLPLRTAKTFHWPRQLKSVELLRQKFSAATLSYICPGANSGYLRGQRSIPHAYDRLAELNLDH